MKLSEKLIEAAKWWVNDHDLGDPAFLLTKEEREAIVHLNKIISDVFWITTRTTWDNQNDCNSVLCLLEAEIQKDEEEFTEACLDVLAEYSKK